MNGLETFFFKGYSKHEALYGDCMASGVTVLTYKLKLSQMLL